MRETETIDSVDRELFDRVCKVIGEIGVQERHFNGIESEYRKMASTWLLATFGAMGFSLTQNFQIAIDREVLLAGVAVAGCVGILLLWTIDLLVYHRLLDSCFAEGHKLELRYRWLPPVRVDMMDTQDREGVLTRVVLFYLAPVAFLLLVAGGALSLWFARMQQPGAALTAAIGGLAVAVAMAVLMILKTGNTRKTEEELDRARKEIDNK
jgi:hypothetical protein